MRFISYLFIALMLISCVKQPYYKPQAINHIGKYTQPSINMVYPEWVGDFKRVSVTKFDPNELNVGVGYNNSNPSLPIAVTVYSSPAPKVTSFGSPQNVIDSANHQLYINAYEGNKRHILSAHKSSVMVEEGPFELNQDKSRLSGMYAKFNYTGWFAGSVNEVESLLYLIKNGSNLYKYRVTYPVALDASELVDRFMKQLVLPGNT